MKILFGLLIILLTTFFISCYRTPHLTKDKTYNETPDLTKDEVYKILNEIIVDDSLTLDTVCSHLDNLSSSGEYGFNRQNKKFIERQNEIFKDFKFESNKLKFYSTKKKSLDFIYIDTYCKEGIVNGLSFPLISSDRQRVVLKITEDCHCELGGQGGIFLYVKQNGHWKRGNSFDYWASY